MDEPDKMEPDRKRPKLEDDVITENREVEYPSKVPEVSSLVASDEKEEKLKIDNSHDLKTETLTATDKQSNDEIKLDQEEIEAVTQKEADDSRAEKNIADIASEKDIQISGEIVPEKDDRTGPVQETDVGITEYISKHEGFQGVIKQRYSDFIVSEIDLSGQVVKLTDFDLPEEEAVVKSGQDVSNVLSESDMEKLKQLIESGSKTDAVMIEVDEDKDRRARIHKAISTGFNGLDSTTVTKDDKKYIQVKIQHNKAHDHKSWPKSRGDYCRFVLYKENKDTMDAVGLVAKQMRLKSSLFQYAGTKDKRAKTSQEVTAYRISAEKLLEVNKKLRNIATGSYRYVKEPLKLGDCKGNRFTMVLRSVTGSKEQIQSAMTSLQEVGFINYYGMQRFGTSSIPTHHIGRAILHSKWKEAVELILKPRFGENKEIGDARTFWWETRDSQAALKKFPTYCFIERTILQGLISHGKSDYLAALKKVARNTQLMYIHSYQSYIWNTMASRRIREFGLKPLIGDLVMSAADSVDCSGDAASEKPVPSIVTADTLPNYSIENVVLPLPGYSIVYPENDVKAWYQELMKEDGLDVDNMRHRTKEYSLSGDYRHVVVRPSDVSWQLYRYDDVTIPLTLSDYDRLNKATEPETVKDGKHVALKIELTLPTSCYATMAIREILKMDTSSAYQSSLNIT